MEIDTANVHNESSAAEDTSVTVHGKYAAVLVNKNLVLLLLPCFTHEGPHSHAGAD